MRISWNTTTARWTTTTTLSSIFLLMITMTKKTLANTETQEDSLRISKLDSCKSELAEARAYQSYMSDQEEPIKCSVKILVPKGQMAQVRVVNQEETCLLSTQQSPPITMREESTNRSSLPCLSASATPFLSDGGETMEISYFVSSINRPFHFSVRFFSVDIECGEKLDFIQLKQPLRLHTRGREQCHVYLPGSSTITLINFHHSGSQCASNVSIGIGNHIAEMKRQTLPKCSIDNSISHDLVCGAGQISIRSERGVKAILLFAVKIIDGIRAMSPEMFFKKIEWCDS